MADIPVGFRPTHYDSGKTKKMKMNTSVTVTKGDALGFTDGLVRRAVGGTIKKVKYVSLEDKTDSGSNDYLKCVRTDGVEFLATSAAAPEQADVGDVVDLSTYAVIDATANGADYVFEITEIVDTTNFIVKGYFHPITSA